MLARRQALQLLLAGLLNSTRVSGAAAADTLKIGLPVPLSGFIAESALQMVQGFKLYLKEKGGKLGGNNVDLIVEDTQADPQAAITKMRKLVESDKVDVVCGFLLASEAYAVRDYADQHHGDHRRLPICLRTGRRKGREKDLGAVRYDRLRLRRQSDPA